MNALHAFASLLPWWGWILVGWAVLLTSWCYPYWRRWNDYRGARVLWRAREDMEAALWAECDAETARRADAESIRRAAEIYELPPVQPS